MANTQLNLQEIIDAFGAAYRSVDVRTVALLHGTSWLNALTVIRVSHETPAQLDMRHSELKSMHVLPQIANFRISLSSSPFCDWAEICKDLRNSILRVHHDFEVTLTGPLDIYSKSGYVNRHHNLFRRALNLDWPTCEISFPYDQVKWQQFGVGDRNSLLSDRKLSQQISRFGHSDAFEAINAFMEFSSPFAQNPGNEFHVSVPIFASIDSVEVQPSDNLLCVSGRVHEKLADVRLFAVCRDSPLGAGLMPKATLALEIQDAPQRKNPEIREVKASVAMPSSVRVTDYVEVKAVGTAGDIDSTSSELRSLLPLPYIQPLYTALELFRSQVDLRQALVYPQRARKVDARAWQMQQYFERDVCWFFSCFGFATVMLGEFENLRDPESKFQRGSLDILAYKESRNLMLIVGCTLNAPTDHDFNNLTTLRTILLDEVLAGAKVALIPVMCCGLKTYQAYWEQGFADHSATFCTVPVLDGVRRVAALTALENKRDDEFYNFLSNPTYCRLL